MLGSGYPLQCKDSVSGIKNVYLFSWAKYSRSQIIVSSNELLQFPASSIYNFKALKTSSLTETMENGANGNAYNQTLNLTFSKIGATFDFEQLRKCLLRAIVEDNNGVFTLLGLYNGLEVTSSTKQTGSSKQELNGYQITLTGKERIESPYFGSLNLIVPTTGWTFDTGDTFDSSHTIFND